MQLPVVLSGDFHEKISLHKIFGTCNIVCISFTVTTGSTKQAKNSLMLLVQSTQM